MAWIGFALLVLVTIWALRTFNHLVRLRNQMRTAWADIDVQLSRRHDLVPQLVSAVRAYSGHERATLETVAQLRTQAMSLQSPSQIGQVEAQLEHALVRLFALQEAYPDLKASENFSQLQRDLVTVENQLQYARRFYNGAVRDYNDAIGRAPDLLVARTFAFAQGEFYQADAHAHTAPQVQLP